jgi:energy-coupling factor transporter ATP-binding protein EcfA2
LQNIRSISVTRLFGRYNYTLPDSSQLLDDVNILYGENGAGKTTLLSLVFHLLSPAENAGHRNRIAEIPFSQLEVALKDGTKILAKKDPQLLVGPVEFRITGSHQKAVTWRFTPGPTGIGSIKVEDLPDSIDLERLPNEMRHQVSRALEQRRFFEELRKLEITVFMLTSDRILLGDSVRDTPRPEPRGDGSRVRARLADIVLEHRIAAVTEALNTASAWVRSKFLERTYGPNESSTNLYLDVAKKIAKSTYRTKTGLSAPQQAKTIAALEQSIADIQRRTAEFQKFGLGLLAVSPELLPTVQSAQGNRLQLISTILEPHLASVRARYDGLQPLYNLVNTFANTVNKFFRDKRIDYSVRNGFRIVVETADAKAQEITPAQLSSGEQQLLLLFCHVLTTRDNPSIFIIDEPELSLNIVWQRMLVASMLEIAKGSKLQLLLASHSMEILAKHRDRVVSMQETQGA